MEEKKKKKKKKKNQEGTCGGVLVTMMLVIASLLKRMFSQKWSCRPPRKMLMRLSVLSLAPITKQDKIYF